LNGDEAIEAGNLCTGRRVSGRAGPQSAQLLSEYIVYTVATGNVGPNPGIYTEQKYNKTNKVSAMYTEKLLRHFKNPQNIGVIEEPDGVGTIGDSSCGDYLCIYIKVQDDRISEIKYKIFGCPAAIATTSVLTELAFGRTLEEALEITDKDILTALGGLPDPKVHCSNLGASALHYAIWDYLRRPDKFKR